MNITRLIFYSTAYLQNIPCNANNNYNKCNIRHKNKGYSEVLTEINFQGNFGNRNVHMMSA